MKNKIPTDHQIIKDVHHAIVEASALGCNWVDLLPDYIDLDQNHADESHYIGTLADGRNLYYTPEAMDICLIEEAE